MDQSRVSGILHVTTSIDLLGGVSQFQQGLFGDSKREKLQEDEGSGDTFCGWLIMRLNHHDHPKHCLLLNVWLPPTRQDF
eukprot:scaffold51711_cov18-Prasinocladus_malaysianus.AAC.1